MSDNDSDDYEPSNNDSDSEWSDTGDETPEESEEIDPNVMSRPRPPTQPNEVHGSYEDDDPGPPLGYRPGSFEPKHPPGLKNLTTDGKWTRRSCFQYLSPGSFFSLFFTEAILDLICQWTNTYATLTGPSRPAMYKNWKPLEREELCCFVALLMYLSIVQLPCLYLYWSQQSLFQGLWAKRFMSRFRFLQMQSFLKCSDPNNEAGGGKLAKIKNLEEYIKRKSMKYWQPKQHVAVDERMVPNKGRYSFRMYMKDKPTKWGMKFWVLADSDNGYTYNFDIYLGKGETSSRGLAFDVVMKLCQPIYDQGYKLFFDNFYSSVALFDELFLKKIYACGTVNVNRKNIPAVLKNTKLFSKSVRGAMRWVRRGKLLFLQWKDNKVVSMISSFHTHKKNKYFHCQRRSKVGGNFRKMNVRQPLVVRDYNKYMGGVDRSDQMIGKYKILRRTVKFWKTIFYHCLDIARVNSFILFQEFRKENSTIKELQRPKRYSQLEFTIELIRELGGIDAKEKLCESVESKVKKTDSKCSSLRPEPTDKQKNCKRCWRLVKIERKSRVKCLSCDSHFCFTKDRNCLLEEHS